MKPTRLTRGFSAKGNADWSRPPVSTADGRKTPAKPSWPGLASGTLITPSEVSVIWFTGMNGTGPSQRTLPVPSVTLKIGAYPWPMR